MSVRRSTTDRAAETPKPASSTKPSDPTGRETTASRSRAHPAAKEECHSIIRDNRITIFDIILIGDALRRPSMKLSGGSGHRLPVHVHSDLLSRIRPQPPNFTGQLQQPIRD